ncbi:uncharacterized protein LOC131846572 [Achroia grisella]|uniref:uncharacterized protein LOC131846572 n=1 Tax=Achroia grisella TaxID=688607 RepID=UPI0027D33D18|nr:uncharacterized protein LOC131846572 [Achroia grisella]
MEKESWYWIIPAVLMSVSGMITGIVKLVTRDNDSREVEILNREIYNTHIGANVRVTIPAYRYEKEQCFIKLPNFDRHEMNQYLNVDGIHVINDPDYVCGAVINVHSQDMVGEWVMIAWEIRYTYPLERRLPFIIKVNETINAVPKQVTITEGNDLYLHLQNNTELHETCKLFGPDENEIVNFELDSNYLESCGFIVKNVKVSDSGKWEIRSGNGIIFRAFTEVTVIERWNKQYTALNWVKDGSVDITIGPEDAVYCRIEDPSGTVVFLGFGACKIVLERTTEEHNGVWKISLTLPEKVLTEDLEVTVTEGKPVLTTDVDRITAMEGDTVTMSCSIQSAVRYCYFRAHNGTVFNVSPGSISGTMEYVGAGLDAGECGIRLRNLLSSDSGSWSCHVGFQDYNEPEQRADFDVTIEEAMTARQYSEQSTLVVEGLVYNSRQLEYCRFVRIDGLDVTSEILPDRYTSHDSLDTGLCKIRIENATNLEHHPWKVVARMLSQEVEIFQSTTHSISMPTAAEPGNLNNQLIFWIPMMLLMIVLAALVVLLVPKRNRKRTLDRMNIIRDSIRGSFQKKPLPDPAPHAGVTVA